MKKILVLIPLLIIGSIYTVASQTVRNTSVSSTAETTNIIIRKKIVSQILMAPMFFPFTKEKLDISIDANLVEPR